MQHLWKISRSMFVLASQSVRKMDGDLPMWPEERTDLKLQIAENKAIKTGVITPLLKEELWTKIQHSRLERGLDELKVEMKNPVKTPLTNEEKTKVANRKEKNREAAVRCRQKRKNKQKELEQELEKEKERHRFLSEKCQSLLDEKEWIMSELGLTSTPKEEHASIWTPPPKEEPICNWTPPPKEDLTCIWTPPPKDDLTCIWTPPTKEEPMCNRTPARGEQPAYNGTPPPTDESVYSWTFAPKERCEYSWTPAPKERTVHNWTPTPMEGPERTVTPPPKELTDLWAPIPVLWSTTPNLNEKDAIWMQEIIREEEASPPPPECFSYTECPDDLQVVPGEGCSSILL
ncbi:fibrous sheath CABYR-binding protein-like [Ylistrum balloti]|uniref:fibrous sheath CABYR-binding protein-like n=1 Tax=Ylistrum balloti TaxID=509963 RepID=UPI002905F375|nr:fibrous sheath CABYR-binding protein-like [Ylistrum balloti]